MSSILITGGHKGLGFAAVERLAARQGTEIILAGRNLAEMDSAALYLRAHFPAKITILEMDVSSLDSVRKAAARLKELIADRSVEPLQALICNAGAQFFGAGVYSVDGYEQTFATNYLGHFLLTNLLLDSLPDDGRIVFTASGTHDPETMDGKAVGKAAEPDAVMLANDGKQGKPCSGGTRYATSKLCMIMFSYELDRRLKGAGSGIATIAFDPGLIVETGLSRSAPRIAQRLFRTSLAKWLFKAIGTTMGSLSFSGASLAAIAGDESYGESSGRYLQCNDGKLSEQRSSSKSYDEASAAKLWAASVSLVRLLPSEVSKRLRP